MKILESFIASPLAGAVGWTLLHSLWEGAPISAILAAVLLTTRSARLRYIAACVAMFAIVIVFGITLFRLMPDLARPVARFRPVIPFIPVANAAPPANASWSWLSMLTAVAPWLAPFWIVGVLLLSLERLMSFFAVRKLRTRGVCFASDERHAELARLAAQLRISRPVHLLESCFAEIPMVLGHVRPVIFMPLGLLANLPAEQVEAILLHELAHIRRADYLVNVFQRLVESLLFYHPAVWWISKVMRTERENCCDDIVVAVTRHPNEYAEALGALERNRLPGHQAAVAATGGALVKRIHRLLYPEAPAGIWALIAAAIILMATVAVTMGAMQPESGARLHRESIAPVHEKIDLAAPQLVPFVPGPFNWHLVTNSRKAYQTIADLEGLNVEFDPSFVTRPVTVDLSHVTVEQALDFLSLETGNRWEAASSNTFVVAAATSQERQNVPNAALKAFGLPSTVTVSQANTIVAQLLLRYGGGRAQYDPARNSIVVQGDQSEIATAEQLIELAAETPKQGTPPPPQPEPKNWVVMAQQSESNGRSGHTNFEISETAQKWLNEDVVYIITDEERDTFLHLKTDEECQQFITAFWERRNPTPGSADNKFKHEHYRRIAYANQHFGTPSGKPGWQTDRGHIYIVYGPPDVRDEFLPGENGSQFATEICRYNHIEGVGDNLSFEFVARSSNGDFTLAPAPSSAQVAPRPGASNAGTQTDENLYTKNQRSRPDSAFIDGIDALKLAAHRRPLPSTAETSPQASSRVAPSTGVSDASAEPNWSAKHGVKILSPTGGIEFAPYINEMLKSVQSHWMTVMPQAAIRGQKGPGQRHFPHPKGWARCRSAGVVEVRRILLG